MGLKMNLRIKMKNYAADLEIGFLPKSILKPNGCATGMPTARKLNKIWVSQDVATFFSKNVRTGTKYTILNSHVSTG